MILIFQKAMGIMKIDMENKIKTIADHYGYDAQSRQCIEEMAELTQAINKLWRKGLQRGSVDVNDCDAGFIIPVLEETADVLIMIAQMIYFLEIRDEDLEEVIGFKLDRQLERIRKEDGE